MARVFAKRVPDSYTRAAPHVPCAGSAPVVLPRDSGPVEVVEHTEAPTPVPRPAERPCAGTVATELAPDSPPLESRPKKPRWEPEQRPRHSHVPCAGTVATKL